MPKRKRPIILTLLGGSLLFVLIQAHADSNLITATADVVGMTILGTIYNHTQRTKDQLDVLQGKTDLIVHQTNSDLDKRMQAQSDYVISTVERMLQEHDEQNRATRKVPLPSVRRGLRRKVQSGSSTRKNEPER